MHAVCTVLLSDLSQAFSVDSSTIPYSPRVIAVLHHLDTDAITSSCSLLDQNFPAVPFESSNGSSPLCYIHFNVGRSSKAYVRPVYNAEALSMYLADEHDRKTFTQFQSTTKEIPQILASAVPLRSARYLADTIVDNFVVPLSTFKEDIPSDVAVYTSTTDLPSTKDWASAYNDDLDT